MFNLETGTGNYFANGLLVHNCHRAKRTTTQTSRALRAVSDGAKYRYGLTGTPAPNGPLDIFGSLTFLDPNIIGTSYWTTFKARHAIMGGFENHEIIGYRDLATLNAQVASCSSRVKKEDALDLPPKTFVTRPCPLSTEQRRIYRQLKEEAIAIFRRQEKEGTLTVRNILTETLRLLQVCGGFLPDDEGRMHSLDCGKADVFEEMLDDFAPDQKVIVWCAFLAEVDAICARLGGRAVRYDGRSSTIEREDAIEQFRNGDAQFFVATPAAGGEGITLTESSTVVYYSRDWNLKNYLQSQDRAHRIGQHHPVTISNLVVPGTIDARCMQALERKEGEQEAILGKGWRELFEEET